MCEEIGIAETIEGADHDPSVLRLCPESMRQLFETLYYGLHKSAPTLAIDSG
jgi:hypothetical protein